MEAFVVGFGTWKLTLFWKADGFKPTLPKVNLGVIIYVGLVIGISNIDFLGYRQIMNQNQYNVTRAIFFETPIIVNFILLSYSVSLTVARISSRVKLWTGIVLTLGITLVIALIIVDVLFLSFGYSWSLTRPITNSLTAVLSIISGSCSIYFFTCATILLLKMNTFASLHGTNRDTAIGKYRIFAICCLFDGIAMLIDVVFGILLAQSAITNSPAAFSACVFCSHIGQIMFCVSTTIMLNPKEEASSGERPKTAHSVLDTKIDKEFCKTQNDL